MGQNQTDDWNKELIKLQKHIAEEIAPDVKKLFKESVRYSLIDYYNSYQPKDYIRTYNFMNGILESAKTSGKGNVLTMSVHSGFMDNYNGWSGSVPFGKSYLINDIKNSPEGKKQLNASFAFDFFFVGGEHGHGKWMMKKSLPPYMYVDADIEDGFGGRVDKLIDKAVDKILK
jgi:hypothetical protein